MKAFGVCLVLLSFASLLLASLITCAEDTGKSEKPLSSSSALTKKLADENVVLSVVKSLVEFASNGFKTGLEASMRSIFNKPVTTAVYALSMLVGVVAMLAFYESPISPMPVPALPDPPVGRFPPEHPVWPPKNQGPNMQPYANQKRAGPGQMVSQASQFIPQFASLPSGNIYPYSTENHRSDLHGGPISHPALVRLKGPPSPNHMNETSYNNYISKLTSTLDLNSNPTGQASNLEQLKHVLSSNSELSNKVIDYNNKRMAMESLKYSNVNSNNQTKPLS